MSSSFDNAVYNRRNHTPWAAVSFLSFAREMTFHQPTGSTPFDNKVVLEARYRHDVTTSIWYVLNWTGSDGKRHSVEASDFSLLLWRAAEAEMIARERARKLAGEGQEGG